MLRKGNPYIILLKEFLITYEGVLIHTSARDATAKSYKIGNNFTVLFRKFMQKLGIAIFTISIF